MPFLVNFGSDYMDEKHIKDSLAQALMETVNTSYETQIKNEETMMEIVNMIGGLQ